ncbi:MAG: HEAT repeat domain-containing protein, partial [Planctomycetota bacterium]
VYDPTVLADGRVCFSYWDDFLLNVPPVDKHETFLMTIRPDGTEQTHLFGTRQYLFFNRERHSGSSLTQAGGLPDGTILLQSEMGPSIFDPRRGMDVAEALWPVFPGTTTIQLGGATHRVHLSPTGSRSTPYPLPDGRFLFSATLPGARDLGIYLADPKTRHVQPVFNDPDQSEYDARPIRLPRPRPAMLPPKGKFTEDSAGAESAKPLRVAPRLPGASRTLPQPPPRVPVTGRARFVVVNARRSDNPEHERALRRARYFRVIESIYTAVTSSSHTNLQTRILGIVPIPADGTVDFEGPADTPLFFEALDAAGSRILYDWNYPVTSVPIGSKQPLMEMSLLTARPGEVKSCHGCHAPQEEAAVSGPPRQLVREPVQVHRDLTDILYRRNEPDEYRAQARIGEAPKYRPWLGSSDPDLRRRACEMLMAIEDGARQDAPAIAGLLVEQPVAVRRAAALALTRLGTLDQAGGLLEALEDKDWQVRFHAKSALEAITACVPFTLTDEDRSEPSKFYERLLAKVGGPEALKTLIGRGSDALAKLGGQKDPEFHSRWFEAVSRLGPAAPESARQIVRKALSVPLPPPTEFQALAGHQHHELEAEPPDLAAIRAAGWMRDVPSVPLLTGWLTRHEYRYHVTEAALALGRIGSKEAIEALWQSLRTDVPVRPSFNARYFQHGPRPEEYSLLRGLILARAAPKLEDVPLVIGMLPGSFLEKPRYEDRLRPETQRMLLGRLLLEKAGLRKRAVALLVAALRTDSPHESDPLYGQLVKGINLERPFSEHGRPFPVVKQIEPEQALWLLGCLTVDASEVPEELILPYLRSENHRERIDAAVLLNRLGVSPKGADLLAAEIAKPYTFPEILSIGKGVREPNFRDKCYMLMALAHHTDRLEPLKPFADPKTRYRDVRYG